MSSKKRSCDVVIVGAGIAGLTSAILLAKKNFNVIVLEREEVGFPFGENTQGIFDEELELLPIIPNELKYQPVNQFTIWSPSKDKYEFHYDTPWMYLIKRGKDPSSIESTLAKATKELGVKIQTNTKVNDIDIKKGTVSTQECRYESSYIVVATGASQNFRKLLGLKPLKPKGVGRWAKMKGVNIEPGTFHGFFGKQFAPGGYGYINSDIESDTATVAISYRAEFGDLNIKKYFRRFLEHSKFITESAELLEEFTGYIVCEDQKADIKHNRALLVGEAAGLQDPTFGFGISYALKSARIVSDYIENNLKKGVQDKFTSSKLQRRANAELWQSIENRHTLSRALLKEMNNDDWKAMLKIFQDREDLVQNFFKTHNFKPIYRLVAKEGISNPKLLGRIFFLLFRSAKNIL